MFELVIANGLVADGVSPTLARKDVAIDGGAIAAVEDRISPGRARRLIDAGGDVVAPGFVDVHSHSDYYLIVDPRALSKVAQGVTTEVGGNCGYAAAPMEGAVRARRAQDYRAQFGIDVPWRSLAEYFEALSQKGSGVNFAALLGYNTIRGSALGEGAVQPDAGGMRAVKKMIAEGLDHGALGMSVGVVYPPACFAGVDEFAEAFRVVAERGRIFTTHIRSEGARLLEALEEAVAVAKRSGARLQVSHLKTAGKANWGKLDRAFEILEGAMADGVTLMADRYPYLASNTGLQVALPDWAFDGGRDALMARLSNSSDRARFKREILLSHPEPEYWGTVMISQVVTENNRGLEGLTVTQGAEQRGKDVFDFYFDTLVEENTDVEAIFFCMNAENLERILKKPWVVPGSDAGARAAEGPLSIGKPHPRTFGTYPRYFGEFVRERGIMPLAEAVRRATSLPCEFFGIPRRGRLTPGYFADVVVFDPAAIADMATYEAPHAYPRGISHVLVNGVAAVEHGQPTGRLGGSVVTP